MASPMTVGKSWVPMEITTLRNFWFWKAFGIGRVSERRFSLLALFPKNAVGDNTWAYCFFWLVKGLKAWVKCFFLCVSTCFFQTASYMV